MSPAAGGAVFRASEAGEYEIRLECGLLTVSTTVTAFSPSVTMASTGTVGLSAGCYDAEWADGRLLCVAGGVSVLDPTTGEALGHTSEGVPGLWGIDTEGSSFATASFGCSACDECCDGECAGELHCVICCDEGLPPGAFLYALDAGEPVLMSRVLYVQANEVSLVGSRLAVALVDRGVWVYDVSDPSVPSALGCVWATGSLNVPLLDGDRLHVAGARSLVTLAIDELTSDCSHAAARVDVMFVSQLTGRGDIIAADGWVYLVSEGWLEVVDTRDPAALEVRAQLPLVEGLQAELLGTRLFVEQLGRITVFDVSDPATPRPVGQVLLEAQSTWDSLISDGSRILHITKPASKPPAELRIYELL